MTECVGGTGRMERRESWKCDTGNSYCERDTESLPRNGQNSSALQKGQGKAQVNGAKGKKTSKPKVRSLGRLWWRSDGQAAHVICESGRADNREINGVSSDALLKKGDTAREESR